MRIIDTLWHFIVYSFIGMVKGLTVNWKGGHLDKWPLEKVVCRANTHWDKLPTGKYLVVQMTSGSNGRSHKKAVAHINCWIN